MGLFSKFKRNRDDEPVDPNERSPQLGLKYGDLMVLNEIAKKAKDLSQPRHVVFYLYTTSNDTGQILAAEARARGFQARVREQHTVLTPDFVRESVDFFEALAEQHQAEYDGWEAAA